MDSQSTERRDVQIVKPAQIEIRAMSAQQIITNSGNTNMLQGRTIRLNVVVPKKS